jgi:hypothetical protein
MDGYEIKVPLNILDGEMPEKGGPNALFIDVVDRPLKPIFITGAYHSERRRGRRRARRRTGAAAPVY